MKQSSECVPVDSYVSCSPHICVVGNIGNFGLNGLNGFNYGLFHSVLPVAVLKGVLSKYSRFSRFQEKESGLGAILPSPLITADTLYRKRSSGLHLCLKPVSTNAGAVECCQNLLIPGFFLLKSNPSEGFSGEGRTKGMYRIMVRATVLGGHRCCIGLPCRRIKTVFSAWL